MKTTTDYAAEVRAALKTLHGWTSRQVSVRAEYFANGSALHVTVKDPAVPLAIVRGIAESSERIRYCEVSGEILSGGNRYVHVRYSHEAGEILARRYADPVQRAINAVAPDSNVLMPVDGTPFHVGRSRHGNITLWGESAYITESHNVEGIAGVIGARMTEVNHGKA